MGNLKAIIMIACGIYVSVNANDVKTVNDEQQTFEHSIKTSLDRIQQQLQSLEDTKCQALEFQQLKTNIQHIYNSVLSCYDSVKTENKLRQLVYNEKENLKKVNDIHLRLLGLRGELYEGKIKEQDLKEKIRIETDSLNQFCSMEGGVELQLQVPEEPNSVAQVDNTVAGQIEQIRADVEQLTHTDKTHDEDIILLKNHTGLLEAVDKQHTFDIQTLNQKTLELSLVSERQNEKVGQLEELARKRAEEDEKRTKQIQQLRNDTLALIEVDLKQKQDLTQLDPKSLDRSGINLTDVHKMKTDIKKIQVSHNVQTELMNEIKTQITVLQNSSTSLKEDLTTFTKSVASLKEQVAVQNKTILFINKRNKIQSKPRSKFAAVSSPWNGHFYAYSKRARVNMTNYQVLCEEAGGYVVEINTEEEYSFIKEFVRSSGVIPHGYTYSDRDNIMIGRSDADTEGTWLYLHSKQPTTFDNWHPGEPNGRNKRNCVNLYAYHFHMHDTKCEDKKWLRRFICEVPL